MKIVAISGSRNDKGQTAGAVAACLDGAGGGHEHILLTTLKLERCRQCDERGWGLCRAEGRCVIQDDFASVVDKIRSAEAVVFATPVYFGDLAESIRAFLDRLRRITRHDAGKAGITDKAAVGICVAGGGGGGTPSCTVSLEKVLATCGFNVVDMIPVRRQNLAMKVELLKVTGKWLAQGQLA